MNLRCKVAFSGVLVSLVAGCACEPKAPLRPDPPGTVFFLLRGRVAPVQYFENNLKLPHDCEKKTPQEVTSDRYGDPSNTNTLYLCKNADAETFTEFGKLFVTTIALKFDAVTLASTAANLDDPPGGSTGLSMTATTTPCDYTYCRFLNSRGPWMLNKACQQFCN